MLQQFKDYIKQEHLCLKSNRILLAVSGGMDSMVMCNLFIKAGYKNLIIAHCNFNLRGTESDKDEDFVKQFALDHKIPFFSQSFNTSEYSRAHSISIQMAARELRYSWFGKLMNEHKLDVVATAHHVDDHIETFFINLLRGSGITGLKGIRSRHENLIRPMLFAGRSEIKEYCKKHSIKYREDRSNFSEKYLRNKIRMRLLPALEEIEPNYRQALQNSLIHLSENEKLYRDMIRQFSNAFMKKDDSDRIYIPIDKLLSQQSLSILAYELLSPFNFSRDQVENMIRALIGIPGKRFYSATHQLLIDREFIILSRKSNKAKESYFIDENDTSAAEPLSMKITKKKIDSSFKIPADKLTACLDFDKLEFPLEITGWKEGDVFRPLGMKGKKKLSDFFTDEKFSRLQKEETLTIRSSGKIVWIVGHRIDDRFKITPSSNTAYIVQFVNQSK